MCVIGERPSFGEDWMADAGDNARHRKGMETRRAVLGDAHVDRAGAATTVFDAPFQDYITGAAWHDVWSGDDLTRRERSMVTLAILAALGHDEEVAMHVRAAANTGATEDDIRAVFMHVALYAGVPAANRAFKIAKAVFAAKEGNGHDPQ